MKFRITNLLASALFISVIPCFSFADVQALDEEYVQLASTLKNEGNRDKALLYYQKALEINPDNFQAGFNLANELYSQEKFNDAIKQYQKVVTTRPDCAAAHFNLGVCHSRQNNFDKAIKAFEQAVQTNPQHVKAFQQLTLLLCKQNKHKEAYEYVKKALELDPNDYEMIYRMGQTLRNLDQFEESLPYFRKAVALQPTNIHMILDLANTLNMLDQTEEAITFYQRILEINPKINEVLYNLGFSLKKLGHLKEAVEIYTKLIETKPDYAQPHFSLSLSYLALGDFERGWKEYEWRWAAYNETPRKYKQPMWDGSDLHGKTILLYAEQGLGDSFQFIRYAKLLKERGAIVIFDAQKPIKQILSLCPYLDKVVTGNDPLPAFDFQIPLMSLPLVFNTTLKTVPAEIPYLHADQKLVEYWKEKLASDKNFKIGICWQGNANYSTQFLRKTVAAKSMHVREFAPLAQVKGISIYNLQKMNGDEQLKEVNQLLNIRSFGPDFDDKNGRFMDTAALIKNLDLVVTIDTSISHFAAALGTPTWILLPEPADWRWMLKCTDTPWYPNVRLFRQPKVGDWKSVMEDIVTALLEIVSKQPIPQKIESPAATTVTSEDLYELIDKLTMLTFDKETKAAVTEYNFLMNRYKIAAARYPTLELLKNQLLEVNKQLWTLDKQLRNSQQSAFNTEFAELSRKIYFAQDLKAYIKTQVHSLQN